MKQADLFDMFKEVTKSLYMKCGISWPLVSYSTSYFSYGKGKGKVTPLQARCGPEGG
jgi:hypothetical protein